MADYKCDKCGKISQTKQGAGQHRRWCKTGMAAVPECARAASSASPGPGQRVKAWRGKGDSVGRAFDLALARMREGEQIVMDCCAGVKRIFEEDKRLRVAYLKRSRELAALLKHGSDGPAVDEET